MVLELVCAFLYLMSEEAIAEYFFRVVKFINILIDLLSHEYLVRN